MRSVIQVPRKDAVLRCRSTTGDLVHELWLFTNTSVRRCSRVSSRVIVHGHVAGVLLCVTRLQKLSFHVVRWSCMSVAGITSPQLMIETSIQ